MTYIDNPRVRGERICPLCHNDKQPGCVICWACNRKLKDHYDGGWGESAETAIAARESFLAEVDVTRHFGCVGCGQ